MRRFLHKNYRNFSYLVFWWSWKKIISKFQHSVSQNSFNLYFYHVRFYVYSQGVRTSAKTLGAYIFIYKACNPINLGAKWKLLFSSFQNCPWMWELDLNWQSYGKLWQFTPFLTFFFNSSFPLFVLFFNFVSAITPSFF